MDGVVFDVFERHGVLVSRAGVERAQEAERPADVAVGFAGGAETRVEACAAQVAETVFGVAEGEFGEGALLGWC